MKLGEFVIDLFVNAAEGSLTVSKLVSTMGELEVSTLGEIGLLWEMAVRLADVTDSSIKTSLSLQNFVTATGLSTQGLQEFQRVALLTGASSDAAQSGIMNLTKGLEDIREGKPSGVYRALTFLGIGAVDSAGQIKSAYQIIQDLEHSSVFKNLSAPVRTARMQDLGLDPSLARALLLSDEQRKALSGEAYGFSDSQQKQFLALYEQMIRMEMKAKDIGITIAAWISPGVASAFKDVGDALDHIDKVLHGDEKLDTSPAPLKMDYQHSDMHKFLDKFDPNVWLLDALGPEQALKMDNWMRDKGLYTDPDFRTRILADMPDTPTPAAAGAVHHHNYYISGSKEPSRVADEIKKIHDDADWQTNRGPDQ